METLVGTVLLCLFCYFFLPKPPEVVPTKPPIKTSSKIYVKATCEGRIKRLYKSYNLEQPTGKTLKMLCEN